MNNKTQDKQIWVRMSLDLVALRELIGDILTDPDYQAVMDKITWGKLMQAQGRVDRLRSEAENRMARFLPGEEMHVFYPVDKTAIYVAVAEFRAMIKEEVD